MEKLLSMSTEEIKNGCTYDPDGDRYVCSYCGQAFESGEVFPAEGRFFDAQRMAKHHVAMAHGDPLSQLLSANKKYTGVTENQKALLALIHEGLSDQEIAQRSGVAPATVRHQRFVLREKAKQAKVYLAIYELAFEGPKRERIGSHPLEEMVEIHPGATMIDERYAVTKAEEEKILKAMFTTLSPLKLKTFSTKEKRKIVILRRIVGELEPGRRYSEKALNEILGAIYEDFATIRRYLIEYGFLARTDDCKEYWIK